jgi:hypothetical protein
MDIVTTFEGLRNSQASDEMISDTILANSQIDFDNRKPPKENSFLGTVRRGISGLIVDVLYYFDGRRYWTYDWVHHTWEERNRPQPYFNFQVPV